MRKRYLIAAGAALMLATGSAVAFAESDDAAQTASSKRSPAVMLPTGDTVALSPNGNATWHAAPGREGKGHLTPPALDGSQDLIMIPIDRMDEIAAGEEDARRYNVSELLRSGQFDAAKAQTLSDKRYGRFVPVEAEREPAADAQKVTLTVTDLAGKPAGFGYASYINPETGENGELELDANGQANVELSPGRFNFHSMVNAGDDIVFGVTSVTVADAPVEVVTDGSKAVPVEYRTDRPAEILDQTVFPYTLMKDGSTAGASASFGTGMTAYVVPTGDDEPDIGIEAVPHLAGTDPTDPYSYDLNFLEKDGIPADLAFAAHDEDLAQVERTFDGLLTTEPTLACNNGLREGGSEIAFCSLIPVEWQTTRTEYVTAGSDLTWYANATIGDLDNFEEFTDIETEDTFEAGPAERVTGGAPVAFNVGGDGYEEPVLSREGDNLSMYLPYMDNANRDEVIEDFHNIKGTAVLKRDGEEIARTDMTLPFAEFKLPKDDAGNYTLSAEVTRSAEVSPLATETKVEWQFASKPTTEATPLDVSAVAFDAEGVEAGYADVAKPQKFSLDYQAQEGAKDTDLKDLTFEVSYDDGKTWEKVDVAVDGDSATGELNHPADAKFVSVRATATDDAGTKVTHSTVHTHGLK